MQTNRPLISQFQSKHDTRFRAIFEAEPECVKIMSCDGILIDMNPAGLSLIGAQSIDQVLGTSTLDLVTPEHRDGFSNCLKKVAKGETRKQEFEIEGLSGVRRWMEQVAAPLYDPENPDEVCEIVAISRDTTIEKHAKQEAERLLRLANSLKGELEEKVELFETIADSSVLPLGILNQNSDFIRYANPAICELMGVKPGDEYRLFDGRFNGPGRPSFEAMIGEFNQNGSVTKHEVLLTSPKKGDFWGLVTLNPITLEGDTHLLISIVDISEQKKTEEKLRVALEDAENAQRASDQKEAFLRTVFDTIPDGIVVSDETGIILETNSELESMFGYSMEELAGQSINKLMPSEHALTHDDYLQKFNRSGIVRKLGKSRPLQGKRKNGQAFPLNIALKAIHQNGEKQIVAVMRDISTVERQAAEEKALAKLLQLGLNETDTDQYLEDVLDVMTLDIQWLSTLPKAGIFLTENRNGQDLLHLNTSKGLAPEIKEKCSSVEFGSCLCGRAAMCREVVHAAAACIDDRHDIRFEGMQPHGHYNVPIVIDDKSIGVIVFYLPSGHQRSEREVTFLERAADCVASGLQRRRIQDSLVKARVKADESNRLKSEFLSTMSHEIRTPLNGVLGLADVLLRSDLQGQHKESVEIIRQSGDQLLTLLNDILDLSRLEAKQMSLEVSSVDICNVVRSVTNLLRPQADMKGIELGTSIDSDCVDLAIQSDEARIRQVLTNLISNAIKFTTEGKVSVGVSRVHQMDGKLTVRFDVKDTGIGIDSKQIERIFDPFVQADQSITRKYGGTGLGLAICERFSKVLGGEIGVESSPNNGSNFWFTIRGAEAGKAQAHNPTGTSKSNLVTASEVLRGGNGQEETRLLVAEDNKVNRLVIGKLLDILGYKYDFAKDGDEALKAIKTKSYNLVLMDINMPVMDGVEVTQKVRGLPSEKASVPIVALTANAMKEDRERYLSQGMDEHIAKPVAPDALAETLSSLLGRNEED